MKTITARELSQNGVSKVITAAESEPVLVTKNNEPSVWIVSARDLALVSQQSTGDSSVYRDALMVVAVGLFSKGMLSVGKAARLAGIPLAEFIQLCGTLHVPIVHEPPGGLEAELAGLEAALDGKKRAGSHGGSLLETAPIPHGEPQSVTVSARVGSDQDATPSPHATVAEQYLTDAANLVA